MTVVRFLFTYTIVWYTQRSRKKNSQEESLVLSLFFVCLASVCHRDTLLHDRDIYTLLQLGREAYHIETIQVLEKLRNGETIEKVSFHRLSTSGMFFFVVWTLFTFSGFENLFQSFFSLSLSYYLFAIFRILCATHKCTVNIFDLLDEWKTRIHRHEHACIIQIDR